MDDDLTLLELLKQAEESDQKNHAVRTVLRQAGAAPAITTKQGEKFVGAPSDYHIGLAEKAGIDPGDVGARTLITPQGEVNPGDLHGFSQKEIEEHPRSYSGLAAPRADTETLLDTMKRLEQEKQESSVVQMGPSGTRIPKSMEQMTPEQQIQEIYQRVTSGLRADQPAAAKALDLMTSEGDIPSTLMNLAPMPGAGLMGAHAAPLAVAMLKDAAIKRLTEPLIARWGAEKAAPYVERMKKVVEAAPQEVWDKVGAVVDVPKPLHTQVFGNPRIAGEYAGHRLGPAAAERLKKLGVDPEVVEGARTGSSIWLQDVNKELLSTATDTRMEEVAHLYQSAANIPNTDAEHKALKKMVTSLVEGKPDPKFDEMLGLIHQRLEAKKALQWSRENTPPMGPVAGGAVQMKSGTWKPMMSPPEGAEKLLPKIEAQNEFLRIGDMGKTEARKYLDTLDEETVRSLAEQNAVKGKNLNELKDNLSHYSNRAAMNILHRAEPASKVSDMTPAKPSGAKLSSILDSIYPDEMAELRKEAGFGEKPNLIQEILKSSSKQFPEGPKPLTMRTLLKEQGGFTIDQAGNSVMEGFTVAAPGHGQVFDHIPRPSEIQKWQKKVAPVLAKNPNLHYGGWESGGKYYLDLSEKFGTKEEAIAAMSTRPQEQAAYDLAGKGDIPNPAYIPKD